MNIEIISVERDVKSVGSVEFENGKFKDIDAPVSVEKFLESVNKDGHVSVRGGRRSGKFLFDDIIQKKPGDKDFLRGVSELIPRPYMLRFAGRIL